MISHSEGTRNFCGRNARARGLHSSGSTCRGFSLPELLVSMAVMLVVAGAVVSLISYNQNNYGRTEQQSDMYENVRAVAELLAQEIGQAGLVNLPLATTATLSAAVTSSATAQTRAVFFDHFDVCRGNSAGGPGSQRRAGNYRKSDFDLDQRHLCKQSCLGRRHPCDRCCSQRNRIPFFQRHTTPGGVSCVTTPTGVTYTATGRFDLQCPEHMGRP